MVPWNSTLAAGNSCHHWTRIIEVVVPQKREKGLLYDYGVIHDSAFCEHAII